MIKTHLTSKHPGIQLLLGEIADLRALITERGKNSSEIATWLVGLSFAAIGFMVSNPDVFGARSLYNHSIILWSAIALTVCVVTGVIQRISFSGYNTRIALHIGALYHYISGLLADAEEQMDDPSSLNHQQLLQKLQAVFSEDPSHFEGVATEEIRTYYRDLIRLVNDSNREMMNNALHAMSCFLRLPFESTLSSAETDEGSDAFLARAQNNGQQLADDFALIQVLQRISQLSFITGVSLLCFGLASWLWNK